MVEARATYDGTNRIDYIKEAYAILATGYADAAETKPIYGAMLAPTTGYTDTFDPAGPGGARITRDFTFKMQDADVDVFIVLDQEEAPPEPEFTAALVVEDEMSPTANTGLAGAATLTREDASQSVAIKSNEMTNAPGTPNTVGMTVSEKFTVNVTANPGYVLDRITITDLALNIKAVQVSETTNTDGSIDYVYTIEVPANAANPVDIDRDILVTVYLLGLKTGRPYDPYHSEAYNTPDYAHYSDEDLSETHQEGWLLGERAAGVTQKGEVQITIPTLYEFDPDLGGYNLTNADDCEFKFYYYDEDDTVEPYKLLELGKDYELSDPFDKDEYYTGSGLLGSQFIFREVIGGKLTDLGGLDAGLVDGNDKKWTLWVTASDLTVRDPARGESDMTELVITPAEEGLRPYDPERVNDPADADPDYEDHWIRDRKSVV